jgi:hypothetical protein
VAQFIEALDVYSKNAFASSINCDPERPCDITNGATRRHQVESAATRSERARLSHAVAPSDRQSSQQASPENRGQIKVSGKAGQAPGFSLQVVGGGETAARCDVG